MHIHGETEEREQRGRRRRVASQTQLQDLRRKGRDGGGGRVSGRPAAAGRAGAGALRCAPRRDSPGPPGLPTAAAATSHRRGAGPNGQQCGPGATGRAGGNWGRMARAAAAAQAEAGEAAARSATPAPCHRRGVGRRGRRQGSAATPSAASWRSWRSSSPRDVRRAPAEGAGPTPAPGKGRAAQARGREGAERAGCAGLAPGGLRLREASAGDWSRGSRRVSL